MKNQNQDQNQTTNHEKVNRLSTMLPDGFSMHQRINTCTTNSRRSSVLGPWSSELVLGPGPELFAVILLAYLWNLVVGVSGLALPSQTVYIESRDTKREEIPSVLCLRFLVCGPRSSVLGLRSSVLSLRSSVLGPRSSVLSSTS
jgi:hypothetical protein